MTEGIWVAIIGGICTITIAAIETRNAKERKAMSEKSEYERKKSEQRADMRARESRLSMEMMSASCKLGVVTAKAVTNQHVNGDVEEAMKAASRAQEEYNKFLCEVTSGVVTR